MPNMKLSDLPVVIEPETEISTKISLSQCPDRNDQERYLYNHMYDIPYAIFKEKTKACIRVITRN